MPAAVNLPITQELQDAVVAVLGTRTALRDVAIVGRRKTNIVADIEEAIATLGGICIVVLLPLPVEINPETPGPYIQKLEIRVRVIENQALNESKPAAAEVIEEILVALHQYNFPEKLEAFGLNLFTAAPRPIEEIPDPERTIYDVIFFTSCGYRPRA